MTARLQRAHDELSEIIESTEHIAPEKIRKAAAKLLVALLPVYPRLERLKKRERDAKRLHKALSRATHLFEDEEESVQEEHRDDIRYFNRVLRDIPE